MRPGPGTHVFPFSNSMPNTLGVKRPRSDSDPPSFYATGALPSISGITSEGGPGPSKQLAVDKGDGYPSLPSSSSIPPDHDKSGPSRLTGSSGML